MPPPSYAGAHPLAELARAFPFHLVISPALTLEGIGDGMARLAPELRAGFPLADHFALHEPAGPLSWSLLSATTDVDFCFVHRRTGLELRGRMVIPERAGAAVFLGTSWLEDARQLADFGVDIDEVTAAAKRSTPRRRPKAAASAPIPAPETGSARDPLAARCARLEQCLRLQQALSRSLAETDDAGGALALLVEALPESLDWAGAACWRKDADGLVAEKTWPAGAMAPGAALGAELAARSFASGAPVWSADGCDGAAGFAIPAHTDAGVVAVITCVSDTAEPDNDELARQLYLCSGQLARFLARQRQKERLTRLTSELTAIFQLSPDGFVAFNDKGTISYLNPAFARMTGVDRDEVRGMSEAAFERWLGTLLDPALAVPAADGGDQVIHLVKPRTTILQRARRDARDIEGRLIGHLLYFRDITLETELLRANGDFLSNAAHELRTPMASIHGFIELLLKRDLAPVPKRNVLDTMLRQSTRLTQIIDELLEVARFDARAARDIDRSVQPLVPVIEATVSELLVRDDARTVQLALPAAAASPLVNIDRDRFVQALTNVLSNAYKYSPDGGAIELSLRRRRRSDQDWVGVAVRDHGIGMSDAELRRLFERFFRAHPSGSIPGTGLGMSMVKKIVEGHGGAVEVASTPGEGTEVTLWLAIEGASSAASAEPATT